LVSSRIELKGGSWKHICHVLMNTRTLDEAKDRLGVCRSTIQNYIVRAGVEPRWVRRRSSHGALFEIIPELLATRRMRFGELAREIHDTYGSVNIRTIHRWVAKLVRNKTIERCGNHSDESYYVIARAMPSHR
jgi:hypothetical protein